MASITTINSGDNISTSRTDINNNFANLNSGKIETSVLDTDTTLAANSDAKVATQKAVKAYVDSGGNVNASTTARGIVEEATSAEVTAGTAAGATGARLFVNPSTLPASTTQGTFVAGMGITAADALRVAGTGVGGTLNITQATQNVDLSFDQSTSSGFVRGMQTFIAGTDVYRINTVTLRLKKTGSPASANISVSIIPTVSSAPTAGTIGTPIGTVDTSINITSVTTSYVDYTFTVNANVTPGNTYAISIAVSTGNGPTFEIGNSSSASYANGSIWTQNGFGVVAAGTVGYDFHMTIVQAVATAGRVYRTSGAVSAGTYGFIGFALATAVEAANVSVVVAASASGFAGLTTGALYYLSDTDGAISTSAGTVSRKVAIATSATSVVVTNIW